MNVTTSSTLETLTRHFASPVMPLTSDACDVFVFNASQFLSELNEKAYQRANSSEERLRRIIDRLAVPIVAIFGILGNVLNLVVLTRKRLQHSMDRLEKSANMGLVALSLSDIVVCFLFLLYSLLDDTTTVYLSNDNPAPLYFSAYKEPLVNTALLTSAWLTVTMAVGRYLAVCRPLHARGQISLRGTRLALAAVVLGSVVVNAPRWWKYSVGTQRCPDDPSHPIEINNMTLTPSSTHYELQYEKGCHCWYSRKLNGGFYQAYPTFIFLYNIFYSMVTLFIPLPVLMVCNIRLVHALRRSNSLQKRFRRTVTTGVGPSGPGTAIAPAPGPALGTCPPPVVGTMAAGGAEGDVSRFQIQTSVTYPSPSPPSSAHHRITPTLIGLIILYLLLVGPAVILEFFRNHVTRSGHDLFQTATVVTNFLQLINFAVNFVLYCVVNAQFRRTCRQLLSCAAMTSPCRAGQGQDEQGNKGKTPGQPRQGNCLEQTNHCLPDPLNAGYAVKGGGGHEGRGDKGSCCIGGSACGGRNAGGKTDGRLQKAETMSTTLTCTREEMSRDSNVTVNDVTSIL